MRTLIVSDIHSNIVALKAVLEEADLVEPVERVLCLGDTVGYGPAPMACLEALWERNTLSIMGNHDAAVAGVLDVSRFNTYAAEAAQWTTGQLGEEAISWLAALPEKVVDDSFLLVHGTPRAPLWDYLMSYGQATDAWEATQAGEILVGHSHIQMIFDANLGFEEPGPDGLVIPLGRARMVINPGSVGQPRDGDPRAAYGIYDDEFRKITLHRVPYDISATQRAMADVGLPEPLISRLSQGR
jgi:diadenosine tetraphosphatase ApaH/serine/threonine PP2A family protein phosphatase